MGRLKAMRRLSLPGGRCRAWFGRGSARPPSCPATAPLADPAAVPRRRGPTARLRPAWGGVAATSLPGPRPPLPCPAAALSF